MRKALPVLLAMGASALAPTAVDADPKPYCPIRVEVNKSMVLEALPLSVAQNGTHLSAVVVKLDRRGEKHYILAGSFFHHEGLNTDMRAILASELNDGDRQPAELYGHFERCGYFKFDGVRANGLYAGHPTNERIER